MEYVSIGPSESSRFDDIVKNNDSFVKFYLPGCPYCENIKADWERLNHIEGYQGKIIEVHAGAVPHIQSECAQAVHGYPTIVKVLAGGKPDVMFNEPRDFDSFMRFIDTHFKKTHESSPVMSRPPPSRTSRRRPRRKSRRTSRRTSSRTLGRTSRRKPRRTLGRTTRRTLGRTSGRKPRRTLGRTSK